MLRSRKRFGLQLLVLASFVSVLTGCKTMGSVEQHRRSHVPASFAVQSDTNGRDALSRTLVFSDPLLVKLIDSAVAKNPDVLAASRKIEMALAQFRIRKGALLPSVSISAETSVNKYGDYSMEGVGNFDTNLSANIKEDQKAPDPIVPNYFLGLRSSWEIDLWGKLKNQKRSAYLQLLASEQGKQLVITSLVAEVASRYYELLALDTELEVLKKNSALQDSAVQIAEVQKEAGRTTELGVQQFRAQHLRTQGLIIKTQQAIAAVENEINFLLGRYPQPIQRSKEFDTQSPDLPVIAATPVEILHRRPDVRQAELLLQSYYADVTAARAALLPALTLSPFVGFNAFRGSVLFRPESIAYGVIGGATAPLLNRSALKGNVLRSGAEAAEATHIYQKSVINAFREVQTTITNLENLRSIYTLNLEEATVLSGAVDVSNELFKVGYASYLEVITAQRNAIEASLIAIETKKSMYQSLITLYRATGGGW